MWGSGANRGARAVPPHLLSPFTDAELFVADLRVTLRAEWPGNDTHLQKPWHSYRSMKGMYYMRLLMLLAVLVSTAAPAFALTVQWTCNPEADMKEYRVEYSADAGASWGVEGTIPHLKPCTSPVSMGVTRYLKPGNKLYRVFAIDTTGNVSGPSATAPYTVTVPPIGNPGGQEEASLPPSPYNATPTQPPPPTPVPPPVPASPSVLAALEQAVDACLVRKLAHRACFKLLQEELRKVTR